MENAPNEATQKLMNAFFRFSCLHRESPVPGIKNSEARVLYIIRNHFAESGKGLKISALSHIMRVTPPTVTHLINNMESAGLVKRATDPGNRRSILVFLTERGETALKQASQKFFASFDRLAKHLGEEKSLLLAELLMECFGYMPANSLQNQRGGQE